MWDRPEQLNAISSMLLALSGLAFAYGALLYVVHLPVFPVREIVVTDPPAHVTYAQVADIVKTAVKGNFFTLSLPAVRSAFEQLPWVRRANVRRKWPDQLEVALQEHVPLARWGDDALVDMDGEIFQAAYDGNLPVFVGPPDSTKEIAIQYNFFKQALAAIHEVPVQIKVTPRRAWELKLADGMTLELGRDHIEERLLRFVGAYDAAVARLQRPFDHVDLRYTNGFAVRVAGLGANAKQQTGQGKDIHQGGGRRASAGKKT